MDAKDWDARYAANELVWSRGPNQFVEEVAGALAPGLALDVAAGEGRNAIWLAEQGWDVLAADFSPVAVDRARRLAAERLGDAASATGAFTAVVADATQGAPGGPATYDLVLFSYLQLPGDDWCCALAAGIEATAPGGRVLVIAHAKRNLTEGYGGPQDPAVLHDPEDVTALAARLAAEDPERYATDVESADLRTRTVPTDDGERTALDTVVVLRRR